jgi:putative sterol carrier protein
LEIKTPRQFFEEELPRRFNPAKAVGVDVIVQLNIEGPQGGDWIVTIKEQKMMIKEGVNSSAMLLVRMKEKDYMDIINDKISGEKAFMTGKIHFKGSIALALKLREMGFI